MAGIGVAVGKAPPKISLELAKMKGLRFEPEAFLSMPELNAIQFTNKKKKKGESAGYTAANMMQVTFEPTPSEEIERKIRSLEDGAKDGRTTTSKKVGVNDKLLSLSSYITVKLEGSSRVIIQYVPKTFWFDRNGEIRYGEVAVPAKTQNFLSALLQYFRQPHQVMSSGSSREKTYLQQLVCCIELFCEAKVAKATGLVEVRVKEEIPSDPGTDYPANFLRLSLVAPNLADAMRVS